MPVEGLLRRIEPFVGVALDIPRLDSHLKVISTDERIFGRCSITPGWTAGIVVVNGIYAGTIKSISGLLIAKQNLDIARTQAIPIAGIREMGKWANGQFEWYQNNPTYIDDIDCSWTANALSLGGEIMNWPLVEGPDGLLNQLDFRSLASGYDEIWFVDNLEDYDPDVDHEFSEVEFNSNLQVKPYCFFDNYEMRRTVHFLGSLNWPSPSGLNDQRRTIGDVIESILNEIWGKAELEEPEMMQVVGDVNGKPVHRNVKIYRKAP